MQSIIIFCLFLETRTKTFMQSKQNEKHVQRLLWTSHASCIDKPWLAVLSMDVIHSGNCVQRALGMAWVCVSVWDARVQTGECEWVRNDQKSHKQRKSEANLNIIKQKIIKILNVRYLNQPKSVSKWVITLIRFSSYIDYWFKHFVKVFCFLFFYQTPVQSVAKRRFCLRFDKVRKK